MKISIITICFNNEKDIRATIESVVNQTYDDIEYIIKDGGSKDGTMAIVNEYKDRISKIISCPDKGIYDAINQGIQTATGDVVGLIHAGDQLYDIEVIGKIARFYIENDVDVTYGHSKIVTKDGVVKRINHSPSFNRNYMLLGWAPSHPSIYARRKVFERVGYYDLNIGYAADYQWMVRVFYKYANDLKIKRIDDYILRFYLGGESTTDYKKILGRRQKHALVNCWTSNGLNAPTGIAYRKWLWKSVQYIWKIIG